MAPGTKMRSLREKRVHCDAFRWKNVDVIVTHPPAAIVRKQGDAADGEDQARNARTITIA